jgi:hypothetical protein
MKDLFQRLKSGDSAWREKAAAPRLTLGAFGKHPGWDDHILGIGVETEMLAQVKQALYVAGIGGQIDSGAWEKLEPEKRLIGYDHTFLWLRPGHLILGQLWSSTDGKGRAKYPMVLCIDGEAIAPGFMLTHILPGLERLREACKATASADQVTKDCRAAQEQLRAILSSADPRLAEAPLSAEARRRFLERRELGPDRLGFLRVLHELGTAFSPSANGRGVGAAKADSHSRHLRLPLAADSQTEALLLWSAFFRCAIPDAVPLLLIIRAGVNSMDVIIGEPASDDFFCLQASNKAMPLATEIPYELPPDLRPRYQALEAEFLSVAAPVAAVVPASDTKAEAPAAPAVPKSREPAGARIKWTSSLFVVSGVILLVAVGGLWLSGGRGDAAKVQARVANASGKTVAQPPLTKVEQDYRNALAEAQRAWSATNLDQAIGQAQLALQAKPGDAVAGDFLQQAHQRKLELAKIEGYMSTMAAARVAFEHKDFAAAVARAGAALVINTNDPAATKLKADAQEQLNLDLAAKAAQQKYEAAVREAQVAFDRKDYPAAVAKADTALGIKKGDSAATKLKADAQEQLNLDLAAEAAQRKYEAAMREAQAACDRKDYPSVVAKADTALGIKKGDPAAMKLKVEAHQGIDLASARTLFDQGEYSKALELCKKHAGSPAFDELASGVGIEQTAWDDSTSRFSQGDYSFLDQLKSQSYRDKNPFAQLSSKAAEEKKALDELEALKQANNREDVKKKLAELAPAGFLSKPPFEALRKWANQVSMGKSSGQEAVPKLDAELEKYLVWFRVLKPADPRIQTSAARKEKPVDGDISPQDKQWYLERIGYLKTQYEKDGILNQNDRQKNLSALRDAILLR